MLFVWCETLLLRSNILEVCWQDTQYALELCERKRARAPRTHAIVGCECVGTISVWVLTLRKAREEREIKKKDKKNKRGVVAVWRSESRWKLTVLLLVLFV